jgi:hypothetical protein
MDVDLKSGCLKDRDGESWKTLKCVLGKYENRRWEELAQGRVKLQNLISGVLELEALKDKVSHS